VWADQRWGVVVGWWHTTHHTHLSHTRAHTQAHTRTLTHACFLLLSKPNTRPTRNKLRCVQQSLLSALRRLCHRLLHPKALNAMVTPPPIRFQRCAHNTAHLLTTTTPFNVPTLVVPSARTCCPREYSPAQRHLDPCALHCPPQAKPTGRLRLKRPLKRM
jgi:hypothetical protein